MEFAIEELVIAAPFPPRCGGAALQRVQLMQRRHVSYFAYMQTYCEKAGVQLQRKQHTWEHVGKSLDFSLTSTGFGWILAFAPESTVITWFTLKVKSMVASPYWCRTASDHRITVWFQNFLGNNCFQFPPSFTLGPTNRGAKKLNNVRVLCTLSAGVL